MEDELIRRAQDLSARCGRTGSVTSTHFLTPAEARTLSDWAKWGTDCVFLLHGGYAGAERAVGFFLPDWMDESDFDPAETICALAGTAAFGAPGHRDWLGAIMGLGIGREWLGDILIEENRAVILCLASVQQHVLLNLDKVGRCGVKLRALSLADIVPPERAMSERSFSVHSARLDAVCAGAFRLSRSAAAEAIAAGLLSLNYAVCTKPDTAVRAGDVLSLRGRGKAAVLDAGTRESKKGRRFITVGVYQ
ncbi:MAG: RNA-binding protein [Ruminococcaceae bacterium]|nr:RNA-binding protein [Oscillospiraceae bacterium]